MDNYILVEKKNVEKTKCFVWFCLSQTTCANKPVVVTLAFQKCGALKADGSKLFYCPETEIVETSLDDMLQHTSGNACERERAAFRGGSIFSVVFRAAKPS